MDYKFIRVVLGTALPLFDRQLGAAVVIAEKYRASGPASWVALEAACGEWPVVESAMGQFRADLKFTHVIVETEETRKIIWGMRGLSYGSSEIPLVTYAAPSYAAGEMGRSYVDQLLKEGRLTIPDSVQRTIENDVKIGSIALQAALCWLKESPAFYAPLKEKPRKSGYLGMVGL